MCRLVELIIVSLISLSALALDYVQTAAFGYGEAATGGGNAQPVYVDTYTSLQEALQKDSQVIIITHDISFPQSINCQHSHITLIAQPGVKLTSEGVNIGFFWFGRCRNIILRNLFMVGAGSNTEQKGDAITFRGVKHGWVDHCTFQDGSDGNFDIVGTSDSITVSWCRFRYLLTSGHQHRLSNLIASNSQQMPEDTTYNITFAYCWWDHGCQQRMVRSRHASIHYLDCYWNSNTADYYIGPENTDCYIEGCWFDGGLKPQNIIRTSYGGVNGVKIIRSHSDTGFPNIVGGRPVITPPYHYDKVSARKAKKMVTQPDLGAGATLRL